MLAPIVQSGARAPLLVHYSSLQPSNEFPPRVARPGTGHRKENVLAFLPFLFRSGYGLLRIDGVAIVESEL